MNIHFVYAYILDDLPDRNCTRCEQCCIDYEGWLQFQNCLYKVCHFYVSIYVCVCVFYFFRLLFIVFILCWLHPEGEKADRSIAFFLIFKRKSALEL